jgi:hypothetical protein
MKVAKLVAKLAVSKETCSADQMVEMLVVEKVQRKVD